MIFYIQLLSNILKLTINSKNPDILMLMYHDILSKNTNNSSTHLLINNKFNFNYNIVETTNDIWLKVKSKNPFEHNINKLNTIGRVFAFSRNSMKFNLHYDVNCKLYDDFILTMKVLELAYENKCNVFRTSDSNLYLYNMLNENSATSGL